MSPTIRKNAGALLRPVLFCVNKLFYSNSLTVYDLFLAMVPDALRNYRNKHEHSSENRTIYCHWCRCRRTDRVARALHEQRVNDAWFPLDGGSVWWHCRAGIGVTPRREPSER